MIVDSCSILKQNSYDFKVKFTQEIREVALDTHAVLFLGLTPSNVRHQSNISSKQSYESVLQKLFYELKHIKISERWVSRPLLITLFAK